MAIKRRAFTKTTIARALVFCKSKCSLLGISLDVWGYEFDHQGTYYPSISLIHMYIQ